MVFTTLTNTFIPIYLAVSTLVWIMIGAPISFAARNISGNISRLCVLKAPTVKFNASAVLVTSFNVVYICSSTFIVLVVSFDRDFFGYLPHIVHFPHIIINPLIITFTRSLTSFSVVKGHQSLIPIPDTFFMCQTVF